MFRWHWRMLVFDLETNNLFIAYHPESFSIYDEAFNHLDEAVKSNWVYQLFPAERYCIEEFTLVLE